MVANSAIPSAKKQAVSTKLIVLLALLIFYGSSALILYGLDLSACGWLLVLLNCDLCGGALLTFLLVAACDLLLRRFPIKLRYRICTAMAVGLAWAVCSGYVVYHMGVDTALGGQPPAGVKIVSVRNICYPAGGAERHIVVVFQADEKGFQELIKKGQFKESPLWENTGLTEKEWGELKTDKKQKQTKNQIQLFFGNEYRFRISIPQDIAQPEFYFRVKTELNSLGVPNREAENERTNILWDRATGRGYAIYHFG